MEYIDYKKIINGNMKHYYELKKIGLYKDAELVLKLTANIKHNIPFIEPMNISNSAFII